MTCFKLFDKQNDAYNMMLNGNNIFLTGSAGTGKSEILKQYIIRFKCIKNLGITSTTGISAIIFGGTTLHSFLGIGLGNDNLEKLVNKINKNFYIKKRWVSLEVLIIDEISMLSPILFDKLEELSRILRNDDRPFGGIQLILAGDFLQLPCVNSHDFCFEAISWNKCIPNDNIVYLDKIIRQENILFQNCLNSIRLGNISKEVKELLESRVGVQLNNEHGIKPTKIYSTNISVDIINNEELDKFAESNIDFYEYEMEIIIYQKNLKFTDKQYIIEKHKKYCNAPEIIQLCVGAQVMLLYNMDIESGLVNGSRGIIVSFCKDIPVVKFLNGMEVVVSYHTWEIEENGVKILKSVQIPLRLAYAITGHRSQGCTLDYTEIDLSNIFEYGQAYVMISRVKNIEGLSIIKINFDKIVSNPKALSFYEKLLS